MSLALVVNAFLLMVYMSLCRHTDLTSVFIECIMVCDTLLARWMPVMRHACLCACVPCLATHWSIACPPGGMHECKECCLLVQEREEAEQLRRELQRVAMERDELRQAVTMRGGHLGRQAGSSRAGGAFLVDRAQLHGSSSHDVFRLEETEE